MMKADRIRRELEAQGFSVRQDGDRVLVSIYGSKEIQNKWPKPCAEAVTSPIRMFCEKNDLRYKRLGNTISVRPKEQ